MSSAYPSMAASGVLSSWLMLATNWFLVLAGDLKILDGLSKFTCSCLHLFEESRVFIRDYSLVRKGIDEFDLTFGEGAYFGAPDTDHANSLAGVHQRDGEHGAITELERILSILGVFACFC